MPLIQRIRNGQRDPTWTIRVKIGGSTRSLATPYSDKRLAARKLAELKRQSKLDDFAERFSSLQRRHTQTVGDLLAEYLEAGCPDSRGRPRTGAVLVTEARHIEALRTWWQSRRAEGVTLADLHDYRAHRRASITRAGCTGARTCELEETTLSNCLTWAVLRRLLPTNPIVDRGTIRSAGEIRHSRDTKPASANELHRLANHLFGDPRSEAVAFQLLFEALTGLRTSEALALRWDATHTGDTCTVGWRDARFLYYGLSKQRDGLARMHTVQLDDPDRPHIVELLEAMSLWRSARCPSTPWYFPGRNRQQPLDAGSLVHALGRSTRALNLPTRTSHGLRAYYTTVRRCQGIPDERIAIELGHAKADPGLVRSTYGDVPPNWRGLANTYTWLPSDPEIPIAWRRTFPPRERP